MTQLSLSPPSPDLWLPLLGEALAVLAVLFAAAWVVSLRLRNVAVVDVLWGPAFLVVALLARWRGPDAGAAQLAGLALVAAWSLRLAGHLALRTRGASEDRRYAAMRERDPRFAWTSLLKVFWLQGFLVAVISLPLVALQTAPALPLVHPFTLLGLLLGAAGLVIETVADLQLRRFKADPAHRGEVLDRGLWRYSRHPNYFGDFCVWWGFWLLALPAPAGLWTVVSPVIMSFLLLRVSGVTLLERDIGDRRPAYRDYVRRTNAFFPGPPRPKETS